MTEDHVLLTLEAPLADGRTLRLEAVGKIMDEYYCGVREVRVYDGADLLQTVPAREGIESFWGGEMTEDFLEYTDCWTAKEIMEVLDLNFAGYTDFGLFGWPANNTIPYYYWQWDPEAEQYQYAFVLQGADAHPETKELTSVYHDGPAGAQGITEYYRADETGALYLDRVEVDDWTLGQDNDRAGFEVYLPPEGRQIPPGEPISRSADLILVRREVPVLEYHEDGSVTPYTEIWELQDGQLQMMGREEYTDES